LEHQPKGAMTMKREFLYGVITVCATLAGTLTSALAEPLDVKPGLWETTAHTQAQGQMPISEAEMKKLSPQQRAAIAKMEARAHQPQTRTFKGCLTQQKLDKDEVAFLSGEPGMKCDSKLTKHTRTSVAGSRHCTKPGRQQTDDFSFDARDREHVTGKLNHTISDGTRTMSSKGDLSSRWISASCGNTH
jgi:hypothetical protein